MAVVEEATKEQATESAGHSEMAGRLSEMTIEEAGSRADAAGLPMRPGEVNLLRVLFQDPDHAGRLMHTVRNLFENRVLDGRQRELIILRIGWVTRCVYQWSKHWPIALRCGLTEIECLAVRYETISPTRSTRDGLVLRATDEILDSGDLSDDSWALLQAEFSAGELLAIVETVSLWQKMSITLRTLRIPLEQDVAWWPPDGVGPDDRPLG